MDKFIGTKTRIYYCLVEYHDYFDGWQGREIKCGYCEWQGLGSETQQGELFEQLVERDCPKCHERILVIPFPTSEEIRSAAADGNKEAAESLKSVEQREKRISIWQANHLSRLDQLPELEVSDIVAAIAIGHGKGEDSETKLELSLNQQVVYSELGFWETIEPLERLVPLLRRRYGDRLKCIDISFAANQYLYGDRLASVEEGRAILQASGFNSDGRSVVDHHDGKVPADTAES